MFGFTIIDKEVLKAKIKYLAITNDNIYTYVRKVDLIKDLMLVSGFRESVIRVFKVKQYKGGK